MLGLGETNHGARNEAVARFNPQKFPGEIVKPSPSSSAAENWKLLREIDVSGQHSAILGRRLNSLKQRIDATAAKIDETARLPSPPKFPRHTATIDIRLRLAYHEVCLEQNFQRRLQGPAASR